MRYDDLFQQLQAELDAGRLTPAELEQVLRRAQRRDQRDARPDLASVLLALGAIVVYAGVALLYGINFDQFSRTAQVLSPFIFPAAAFAGAVLLARTGAANWQRDLAGVVGLVSLVIADIVAGAAFNPDQASSFGLVVAGLGVGIVLGLHIVLRSLRVTGFGLGFGLAVLVVCVSDQLFGLDAQTLALVLLAEAIAAGVGAVAVRAAQPQMATYSAGWAAILAYSAAMVGQAHDDGWNHLTGWHAVLTVAVAGCFVAATAFEMDALIWVGALGALLWLGSITAVVGTSSGWAFSVVMFGCGLAGLGWAVTAARRRARPAV
jgi:hypothetical protein